MCIMRRIFVLVVVAFLLLPVLAKGQAEERQPVVVGSKIDTEGALLGQMMLLLLRSRGLDVENQTEFGTTPIVRKAIKSGQLDLYPEYTGNGAFFFDSVESEVWRDADRAYARVKELDREENDLLWLQPAPANNTWAIAVRRELARRHDLTTLEDFAEFVNSGGRVKLACCEEFVNREDVLPAFQEAYSFSLQEEQLLVFSGCNTSQTEQAAARGTSGVNFAMAFGTDGSLSALDLRVLEDTKNIQPVYQPAPLIRQEVKQRYPEIPSILAPLFRTLDRETLQKLNSRIAVEGRPAEEVARQYLQEQGMLGAESSS
ncbi:MAG: ABC transporter substrate-binding protein [Desulfohalobiaceae bacterium]|nr:ABC transporter substrate-binding protein [Desulfohalobiaceae bacterium]